ncbi:MAG: hypothetical protein KC635_05990 [Myxococcales bacterium]|nr:hypothetical protein [Myxococcales bacterium]MCB9734161.1 hypothetical protein [Deltaproteobacteria bacterium]
MVMTTSGGATGRWWRRAAAGGVAWRALGVGLAVAVAVASGGCGGGEQHADGAADAEVVHAQVTARTLDGVVAIELGDDFIVHAMERSIFATTADAAVRLYLRWDEGEPVIRAVGAAKEALAGRGWDIVAERHYEAAAEITAQKGRAERRIARQMWLFERGGRVVTCEAVATTATIERLQAGLRAQCQRVEVTPTATDAAAEADATGGGAGTPTAPGDAGAAEEDTGIAPGPAP